MARRIVTVECSGEACSTALYNHCTDANLMTMMMAMTMRMMMMMAMTMTTMIIFILKNNGTDAKQKAMPSKIFISTFRLFLPHDTVAILKIYLLLL